MKLVKIPHYVRKVKELGLTKSCGVIMHRMHTKWFEQYTRYKVEKKQAGYNWQRLSKQLEIKSFDAQFARMKKHSLDDLVSMYAVQLQDTQQLMSQAQAFAHSCFDILGSREQCLLDAISWHSDFRLRHQNPEADYLFDKKLFYKDVVIQTGLTDRLIKDIKVPWEISRFQHLFVMGAAFKHSKNEMYAHAFEDQVTDFLDHNPFLLGTNWVCPMDVGIRALNWVWGFHFFKDSPDIGSEFWQRFVCSLYDHLYYLENNWEVFGTTSNHYLSDLIGYFYVTWLFQDTKEIRAKHVWCYRELLKELDKQVFDEGTDYEGSTKYHCLVTEIFHNFYLLSQVSGFTFPVAAYIKLQRMFSFIDWVTVDGAGIVTIGDDDSGKILYYGVTPQIVAAYKEQRTQTEHFFKDFGLAVHKSSDWHVTLRHHAYTPLQPSGHFHNDVGSITLAYQGTPVVVDPGSYVYTPSAQWRNLFRSAAVHNSFSIEGVEPVVFSEESLFTLALAQSVDQDAAQQNPWQVYHNLYSVGASRVVAINQAAGTVTLQDVWEEAPTNSCASVWNFTLAPDIEPLKVSDGYTLLHNGVPLLGIRSHDLVFEIVPGWYAPSYGTKVACKRLVARCAIEAQAVIIQFFKITI